MVRARLDIAPRKLEGGPYCRFEIVEQTPVPTMRSFYKGPFRRARPLQRLVIPPIRLAEDFNRGSHG
jgi:hypothetical protein